MIVQGVSAKEIWAIIQVKNIRGWIFGSIITDRHKNNSKMTLCYLNFLANLMNHQITDKEILTFLQVANTEDYILGHAIAIKQDARSIKHYLNLLAYLIERDVDKKGILALFTIKFQRITLGNAIMMAHNETILHAYLTLLIKCRRKGYAVNEIYNLIMSPLPKTSRFSFEKNILSDSVHKSNPTTIYLLLRTCFLKDEKIIKH